MRNLTFIFAKSLICVSRVAASRFISYDAGFKKHATAKREFWFCGWETKGMVWSLVQEEVIEKCVEIFNKIDKYQVRHN